MNRHNDLCGLVDKISLVLEKITESKFKIADESYLDKLLTNIREELDKSQCDEFSARLFIPRLNAILKSWDDNRPEPRISAFVLRFVGALVCREADFHLLLDAKIPSRLVLVLGDESRTSSVKLAAIGLLSDAAEHPSGRVWLKETRSWKDVIKLVLTDSSIYVEREGTNFVVKLLSASAEDLNLHQEIHRHVLRPLVTSLSALQCRGSGARPGGGVLSSLRLLSCLLDGCLGLSSFGATPMLLIDVFELESILRGLLETCGSDALISASLSTYIPLILIKLSRDPPTPPHQIPLPLVDLFKLLIKRGLTGSVLQAAKLCQVLWNKMCRRNDVKDTFSKDVEMHFIIIQMIPVLMFIKKTSLVNQYLEMYLKKLADLTSEETIRLIYKLRDVIQEQQELMDETDWALKGVFSLTANIEALDRDRAVLIFQGLMYVLKDFCPNSCEEDEPMKEEEVQAALNLCVTAPAMLSAILNALSTLITAFQINWTESFESLCVLTFCSQLLNNPRLTPLHCVQALRLAKLAITHYLPPNLALLMNRLENSSVLDLGTILYRKLHDVNWEVRDSCLEVVTLLAELADVKYPVFQELLLDLAIPALVVAILDGDSESYVRACALRALASMVRVERLWAAHLKGAELPRRVIKLLRGESEGVVRREAAWLIKEVFEHQHCRPEILGSLYEVMAHSATNDFHWEVKVNSLLFWEKVIEKLISDQGMIDGSFPSITFSKQNKKIVTLTSEEIKKRLNKVLNELSDIGCLHVLLSTLNDDCDFKVVQTSARIIGDLLTLLKRYGVIREKICCGAVKRKKSDETCCEKRAAIELNSLSNEKSDEIIESIVNDMDINLLVTVCGSAVADSIKENGEIPLRSLKPEVFLDKVQFVNLNGLVQEKGKWLLESADDLGTLLNDILTIHSDCETNILDCY